MSELIDRKALKDYVSSLSTHPLNEWDTWGVIAAIDKQPTVAAPRWHRVDEELPPQNKTVLVCKIWGDVNGEPHKVITMDSFTISPSDSVIAWMPLPEPPKED